MQSFPTDESVVRVEHMNGGMTKFHLGNNRVLHRFTAPDNFYPHDHQHPFTSTILSGGYEEEIYELLPDGCHTVSTVLRLPGTTHDVKAGTIHRLVRLLEPECWSLCDFGRKEQESAFFDFHHPEGPKKCFWFGMANGDWQPLSA